MIDNGEFDEDDRIWSEREIREKFDVSRNTAQSAIDELEKSGLVVRIQGKGTYINKNLFNFGLENLVGFSESILMKGETPSSKVLSFQKEIPSQNVAQKLKMTPENCIYKLDRLRFANDVRMMHEVSYLPCSLFPDLEKHDFSRESLYAVIEKDYSMQISWQNQIIRPIISTKKEVDLLGGIIGSPLIVTECVTYLEDNVPVEVTRLLYRSDLYELSAIARRR